MSLEIVGNATCTFCGCVCDDINLHTDGQRIHKAERACVLGKAWFLNHAGNRNLPAALVDGQETSLDEAIQAAAQFMVQADLPLVYGMSNTTCEAQRECVAMADSLGGIVDSHTSL